MDNFNPVPDSISHKQLNSLIKLAKKQLQNSGVKDSLNSEKEETFMELLSRWSALSQELLEKLNHKSDYIGEGRSPKSLMALGALEAHLNMAIQAQKAWDVQK